MLDFVELKKERNKQESRWRDSDKDDRLRQMEQVQWCLFSRLFTFLWDYKRHGKFKVRHA